jgi:hypothetical protein
VYARDVLLTRDEQTYDFGRARFDLDRDRDVLSWIFSLFLFVEVTGVQVGRWLAQAPDFEAAQFLARQANEEMAQEEGHVSFGEDQTLRALRRDPSQARQVLGLALVSFAALGRFCGWVGRRYPAHPLLSQMLGFLLATLAAAELRMRRMEVLDRPLAEIPAREKVALATSAVARRYGRALNPVTAKPAPLTDTYLGDPAVRARLAGPRGSGTLHATQEG